MTSAAPPRVSVCVIARDAEAQLPRCLRSARWADERIVVVDDRTTDGTEKVARELGARVVRRRYPGDVEQKNHALELASHRWVLSLDADEALSPALSDELRAILAAADAALGGVWMNRVTWHLGRWIRHGGFHPDWKLRLFRRDAARWEGTNPHGRVVLSAGSEVRARGDLEHYSYADLAAHVARAQQWSAVEAAEFRRRGAHAGVADLLLRPPARFLRDYVLKRGFRDGVPGLIVAGVTAFHVFLRYAKVWEAERARRG